MNATNAKALRRSLRNMSAQQYGAAVEHLRATINKAPLRQRLKLAWAVLRRSL